MAKCVEMERSASVPIPGPSYAVRTKEETVPSGLPKNEMSTRPVIPRPIFNISFFSLGKGERPNPRDHRLGDGHPFPLCTPLSPPPEERRPTYDVCPTMYCATHSNQHQRPQQSLETITKHLQGMELNGTSSLAGFSDCGICGKSVEQIKDEAVDDYLYKTTTPN